MFLDEYMPSGRLTFCFHTAAVITIITVVIIVLRDQAHESDDVMWYITV